MTENGLDAAHLVGALEGDETAQRALYEAHHARAFRLAYLVLQDKLDAEEVVQDAFVYAFRNIDRYDPDRASFWTWLRVILVSRCRNKRRRKQLPRVSLEALAAVGRTPTETTETSDPAGALERLDARRRVWQALQEVSEGARDALILRYYEGLPYAEMAEILGCSNDAARSRVVHGKAQLRRLLTASEEEERSLPEGGIVRPAEVG
jgi:RNA polymerase sigma-70 factor (ECF subfamily)